MNSAKTMTRQRTIRPVEVDYHAKTIREFDVPAIRAVARLLDSVVADRHECKGGWEEFGHQVDALSEALTERVDRLEDTLKQWGEWSAEHPRTPARKEG